MAESKPTFQQIKVELAHIFRASEWRVRTRLYPWQISGGLRARQNGFPVIHALTWKETQAVKKRLHRKDGGIISRRQIHRVHTSDRNVIEDLSS